MQRLHKILFAFVLPTMGCVADDGDDLQLRSGKIDDTDDGACGDDRVVQPGDATKAYTVKSTTEIALADGVHYTLDPKTNVVFLDDGITGVQCRCASGCSERTSCEASGGSLSLSCEGWCDGTSNDGVSCSHCEWHTVEVPMPGGGSPGALDPTGDAPPKPPGVDPTAGGFDPTK